MIKGIYNIIDKEELLVESFPNFITDKGYAFWTGYDPTISLESISKLVLGVSMEGIADLAPDSSLEDMQADSVLELETTLPTNFEIVFNKTANSAVIVHKVVGSVVGNAIVHEMGLKLSSGELLSNSLLLSNEKTDVIPVMIADKTIEYNINIVIPSITKEYDITLLDNNVETPYKVVLALTDTTPTPDFSLRNPIKVVAKAPITAGYGSVTYQDIPANLIRLSSFNPETKEAVYNLVFPYNSNMTKNPDRYTNISVQSSLGNYKVTLFNMSSGDPINTGFPETNTKDLIIPFKLTL